jgi:anti-sigma B factor antagonist
MGKKLIIKCDNCGKRLQVSPERLWSSRGVNIERCPSCGYILRDVSRKVAEQTGRDAQTVIDTIDSALDGLQLLELEKQGQCIIAGFQVSSVLDQDKAQQLDGELRKLLSCDGFSTLIMNFEKVRFMSSMIVGRLIRLHRELKTQGKTFCVCNLPQAVREIFEIMKLDKLFEIYDSEEDAMGEVM